MSEDTAVGPSLTGIVLTLAGIYGLYSSEMTFAAGMFGLLTVLAFGMRFLTVVE